VALPQLFTGQTKKNARQRQWGPEQQTSLGMAPTRPSACPNKGERPQQSWGAAFVMQCAEVAAVRPQELWSAFQLLQLRAYRAAANAGAATALALRLYLGFGLPRSGPVLAMVQL
jgi:hypothetical protein